MKTAGQELYELLTKFSPGPVSPFTDLPLDLRTSFEIRAKPIVDAGIEYRVRAVTSKEMTDNDLRRLLGLAEVS